MTFEEFFKKKRIDLDSFSKADPRLLAEFKDHFEQMGEKSFDHTKKYWFNKLRHQYHLALEIKTEKPHIANPLAEQTITESLSEKAPVSSAPKMGFTPKFRAGATNTTTAKADETPVAPEGKEENTGIEASPAPKVGFTPRFKAGVIKPASETQPEETQQQATETKGPEPAAKPAGFTPRFKAGVTKPAITEPKVETLPAADPDIKEEEVKATEDITPSAPIPKPGFTPRFKAGVTKPVKAIEAEPASEATAENKNEDALPPEQAENAQKEPVSKPAGFTPRFKAKPKDE